MRAVLLLLLALMGRSVAASDLLILIDREAAGPVNVRGEWFLWPPTDRVDGANRLLSLLTGLDWAGSGSELAFGRKDGGYQSASFHELQMRGYFGARDRVVDRPTVALAPPTGLISAPVLLLALDGKSPVIKPLPTDSAWPLRGLAVAEADSWDAVAALVNRAGGRVLVVEYPETRERVSRYWLQGSGWPRGLPTHPAWNVPGLLRASDAGALLLNPGGTKWVENDVTNWGGANRWVAFFGYATPASLAIVGFLLVIFGGCAAYLISHEEHALFASEVLRALALFPAAVLITARIALLFGPESFVLSILGSVVALAALGSLASGLLRKVFPAVHPLFGTALIGFVATLASDPTWSIYSNILGAHPLPVSPEGSAAFFTYLCATYAFGRGSLAVWVGRILALLCLAWGAAWHPWWCESLWSFVALPAVAAIVGEGFLKKWMLPAIALLGIVDGGILHGVTWAPGDLFWKVDHAAALNLARYVEFIASPGFLGCAVFTALVAALVERFFFHEARRTLLRDSRARALYQASLAAGAVGLLQPLMLETALFCFVGATCVLLWDTSRAL